MNFDFGKFFGNFGAGLLSAWAAGRSIDASNVEQAAAEQAIGELVQDNSDSPADKPQPPADKPAGPPAAKQPQPPAAKK